MFNSAFSLSRCATRRFHLTEKRVTLAKDTKSKKNSPNYLLKPFSCFALNGKFDMRSCRSCAKGSTASGTLTPS